MSGRPSPLSWSASARYGALGLPLAFLALPMTLLLPHHYAQQHGVPLALLGALLMGTRLLDTALDPWIGAWMDRRLASAARGLRAIAWGAAVAVAVAFVALFFAPFGPAAAGPALWLWLGVHLVVVYLGYSVLSVLHHTWGMQLGGDAGQRSRVAAAREGFALAGLLLASVLPSAAGLPVTSAVLIAALAVGLWLLWSVPLGPRTFGPTLTPARTSTSTPTSTRTLTPTPAPTSTPAPTRTPTTASTSATTSTSTSTSATHHAVESAPPPHAPRWWQPIRHRPFRALLALYMLNGVGNAVAATLMAFFVEDRLQLPAWMPAFLGSYALAAVVSLPLWLAAVKRFGLATAWAAGMALSVGGFGLALGLDSGDGSAFIAVCVLSGAALGADLCVPAALLTGLLQRDNHHDQAGVFAGWWTAATKLNLALAAGIALPLLAVAGYAPGRRDDGALLALSLAYVLVPCLLKLTALAGLLRARRSILGET